MSDQNNDAGNGDGQQQGETKPSEFKAPTTQEEFDRMVGARLDRERAKFADYDDLKAKAVKFDEVEQSNKSELEKAQERINELEGTVTQAQRAALVTRIASEEGVIPEVLHGDTEEEMRAAAARVKEWAKGSTKAPPSPRSLASGSSGSGDDNGGSRAAAAVRQLRGNH